MKNLLWICLLVGALLTTNGCRNTVTVVDNGDKTTPASYKGKNKTDDEEEILLSEVPAKVMAAARKAVDGIKFTGAERETENDQVVYELKGTANGKTWEVEVTADGKVLEVEDEDDEDEDDEDDDDDDGKKK